MSDEYPHLIETEPTNSRRHHFPILAQLGILGVILLAIFSSVLFSHFNNPDQLPIIEANLSANASNRAPFIPQKISPVDLRAESAYVWDVRNQRALFSKNEDSVLPLASITKLMTTLLAYELVSDDTTATIDLSAILQEGASGLAAGEQLETADLRELALISSSNDAAFALAASVGQLLGGADPTTQFIRGMNIRAEELQLSSLEFWNTTGLDLSPTEPGAVGNARDVSFLMEYIIEHYPEIIAPTQESATRIYNTDGAYHDANNTNEIVTLIPNMIGSKTGFTDLAGGNLTIAFNAGLDRPIIITVLGSTRDERFSDVLKLVDAVQTSFSSPEEL